MSRVASSRTIFLVRRAYTVAAVNVNAEGDQAAVTMMRKVVDQGNLGETVKGKEKEVFWMRDPKTGNWLPETHFDEVDAADLRTKFLSKKP